MKNADRQEGGFGSAPKFPQTFTIQYLLRYYHFTKKEEALQQACLSLDKMIQGGLYDQVGGGFARYSTDAEWLAPHFEKMLYDNALLISVLSEAYQLTHKELYRRAIEQTMSFIQREMLSPENGFYSALDADSEGEEGKFYVWSKKEIEEVLAGAPAESPSGDICGDENSELKNTEVLAESPDEGGDSASKNAELFCAFYDVSEQGNWEGQNILRIKTPVEAFAAERALPVEELEERLQKGIRLLLERRAQRVRPALDDKILLSWNALFNTACSKAYAVLKHEEYRQLAIRNMQFMLKAFYDETTGGFPGRLCLSGAGVDPVAGNYRAAGIFGKSI
jgi:uncharacterized protein YyaL (SSP411 family)